jgi:hypothetical protein
MLILGGPCCFLPHPTASLAPFPARAACPQPPPRPRPRPAGGSDNEDEWSMLQREVMLLSASLPGSTQPSQGGATG